ncbi:anti-sigma factor family protein [Streptomyces sp. NPDC059009]|uniref:anti-sigma factor family protein n=1 Tax=Streptomyces sp. NPDC059009 TaxID=3346694 RepID=UPI00368F5E43
MTESYGRPARGERVGDIHETVGAYALGVLDDAEATAFEQHLADCELCARQLEEFSGMEPMLAALAGLPDGPGAMGPGEQPVTEPSPSPRLVTEPSPRLADGLMDEVAARRAQKRRRGLYLVAAAAALIIGGPLTVVAVTDGGGTDQVAEPHSTSPAKDAFFHHMTQKVHGTDPDTLVTATVGTEDKPWGTHTVLELKNVKGPLKCSLIAVGKNGERETVTSWSVPKWGYGIKDSPHEDSRYPLYVHGGAAFDRNQIDHFEVQTFEGKRLVEVDA